MDWNTPFPADQQTFPSQVVFNAGLRHHHIANTAYPIHHSTTMRPYRVPRDRVASTLCRAWADVGTLGLYVHVPFCQARCKYCEYTVVKAEENAAQDVYFDALMREFELYQRLLETERKTVVGFDIGGGTPALASVSNIRRTIDAARRSFALHPGVTISIETTPHIADRQPDKIRALKEMGIDRISMGVQTTHPRLGKALGREYTPTMLERAAQNIRDAGFDRFNIDLMYGFARQSQDTWRNTLLGTIELGPEYITLYQMRYKGTRIESQAAQVSKAQVNQMVELARTLLHQAGYKAAIGKNTYSRIPGDVGTSDYLTERVIVGTPYLGLGLGAQSLSHHTLAYNLGAAAKALSPYLRAIDAGQIPIQDLYDLPIAVSMAKMISVSFYFGGINLRSFEQKFGIRLEEQFPDQVAFILENELMTQIGDTLQLTLEGERVRNGVMALFYASSVQAYLIHLKKTLGQPREKAA